MGVRKRPLAGKASLSGIRKAIRAELNRLGVDPSLSFDCLVAVTEACTNALMHGKGDEDPAPEVSWDINGERALFLVHDYSNQPWSRASHPSHDPDDLEARVGGFGLDLMRGLMDEVQIDIGPEGTAVSLLKRLRD